MGVRERDVEGGLETAVLDRHHCLVGVSGLSKVTKMVELTVSAAVVPQIPHQTG